MFAFGPDVARANRYAGSACGPTASPSRSAGVAREQEHDQAQVVREQAGASLRAAVKRAASARRRRPRREPGSERGIRAHVGSTARFHDQAWIRTDRRPLGDYSQPPWTA